MNNMYKHSPLTKWVQGQVTKHNVRDPRVLPTYSYKRQETIDILDVYRFHARKQKAKTDPKVAKWKGGDAEDRRDYIKEKKAEMSSNLERVLGLSSKRMPSHHVLKQDMASLEFREVFRSRHITEGWIQPAEMAWSIERFVETQDKLEELTTERAVARLDEATAELDALRERVR